MENNDTGQESNTFSWDNVDWDNVPDEAISKIPSHKLKSNPAYSKVLEEAIERRQTIQELKQNKPEEVPSKDTKEVSQPDNVLLQEVTTLKDMLAQMQQAYEGIVTNTRQATLDNVATQYGLTDELKSFITATDKEGMIAQAKTLAKYKGGSFSDPSGTGSETNPVDSLRERLQKRLTGERESTSVFDVDTQRRLGGGVLNN